MFGKKKATHVMDAPTKRGVMGGPISIYGRKDKNTRQKAADAAGVPVTFRKLGRKDR